MTDPDRPSLSALERITDLSQTSRHVRKVPIAEVQRTHLRIAHSNSKRLSSDVRRFSSRVGGAAGSISAFAEPVELLSCAGSCTWGGICTCAPHLTSLVPSCAPRLTSLVPSCAPLLTPLHANGLSLSIGYCQYRRGRREAERSRQSHQRKGLSARDHFRLDDCTHVKPPLAR
jgi:hypothetical protein